jgi:hypothetical protein
VGAERTVPDALPVREPLRDHGAGIVYRCIATHLIKKAGFSRKTAQAGAVTPIQRFGSALNQCPLCCAWMHECRGRMDATIQLRNFILAGNRTPLRSWSFMFA